MKPTSLIAGIFASLFLICFCFSDASAQRFKKKKPETLYARNKKKKISPIYVGIGTAVPTAQLHVFGKVRFEALENSLTASRIMALDNDGNLYWKDLSIITGGNFNWQLTGNNPTTSQFFGTINNEDLRIRTNNIQRAVLTNAGTFGLGVTVPTAQFHTSGSIRFEGITANNALSRFAVVDNNGNLSYRDLTSLQTNFWSLTGNTGTNPATNFLGTSDNQRLVFRTNNTEKATILANGRVGINNINPQAQLVVTNNAAEDNHIRVEGLAPSIRFDGSPGPLFGGGMGYATINNNFVNGSLPGDIIVQSMGATSNLIFGVGGGGTGNGIERMRINSNGFLGIGTSSPTAMLHTIGTVRFQGLASGTGNPIVADANGNLFVGATATGNFWSLTGNSATNPANNFLGTIDNQRVVFRTNNTEKATILANGRVGINNTNPQAQLVVTNTTAEDNHIRVEGLAPSVFFDGFQGPLWGGRLGYATINNNFVNGSVPGDIILQSLGATSNVIFGVGGGGTGNGIERMRINQNGFVGIGTASPTAMLHSTGTVRFQGLPNGTGNPIVADANGNLFVGTTSTGSFWSLTGNAGTNPATNFLGTTDNQRLVIRTNNTERATILANGRVGINNNNPSAQFVVTNNAAEDNHIRVEGLAPSVFFEGSPGPLFAARVGYVTVNNNYVNGSVPGDMVVQTLGATSNLIFGVGGGGTGNGIERMRIYRNGYLGIATQLPTAKLHVNCIPITGQTNPSNVRFEALPTGTGNALVIDANGYIYKSATLTGRPSEQEQLKNEIDALKKEIDELKAVVHSMKGGSFPVSENKNEMILYQNAPNPFTSITTIKYNIPQSSSRARLQITDMEGNAVKTFQLYPNKQQSIDITAGELAAGTYFYSLIVNDRLVDSKKMVLTR